MKYFQLIRKDIDVTPFLQELTAKSELWLANTGRQETVNVQRETNNILLRTAVKQNFAEAIGGELARVTIVKLLPNSVVYPHIDKGKYYLIRNRYHLVIQSKHGSELIAGDERVVMQAGELWRFDNKQTHEAHNLGDEDRIHVIFDVLPLELREQAWEYLCRAMVQLHQPERVG